MSRKTRRRNFLRLVGATAFGTTNVKTVAGNADDQLEGQSWTHPRYDTQNRGAAPTNEGPSGGFVEEWRYTLQSGQISTPVVTDDVVYVAGTEGELACIDAATGDEIWATRVKDRLIQGPIVADGTIYVADDQGQLLSFDAVDGSEIWRFEMGRKGWSIPKMVNGTVYIGSADNNLYAIDAVDGTERWRFVTRNSVGSSPAVVDGTVYIGSHDGTVYAIDEETGIAQWSFPATSNVGASVAVADGRVFFGDFNGHIFAVSADDGTQLWRSSMSSSKYTAPAVSNETVLVGDGNILYAFNPSDGTEQWRYQATDSFPIVADETVYISGSRLTALDIKTGKVSGWYERTTHSATVANGRVYASSTGGAVYALKGGIRARINGPTFTKTGETATFDGSPSRTSADDIEQFEWSFGPFDDFSTGGSRHTLSSYLVGTQNLSLRVTDTDGRTATATKEIEVRPTTPFLAGLGTTVLGAGTLGTFGIRHLRGGSVSDPDIMTTKQGSEYWAMPGRSQSRRGAVPTEPGPTTAPETAWTSLSTESTVETPMAIDRDKVIVATEDEILHALDITSGDAEWTVDLEAAPTTAPAIADETVYIGTDKGIHAHRVGDGKLQWTMSLDTVTELVAGDAVYVGTGAGVNAFAPATGTQQWISTREEPVASLAVGDEHVYTASGETIAALDSSTGEQQWTIKTSGRELSLAVNHDALAVVTCSDVAVHDPVTGEQLWADNEGGQPTAVALAHGHIYQTTDSVVRALNVQTGTEGWRTALDATTGPVVVGDNVYVGTERELVALDAEDGDYAFIHDLPGLQGSLAVVGNAVLCQTVDGTLTAVTAELSDQPQLHATTADSKEEEEGGSIDTDEDDTRATDTPTPASPAGRFARNCDAVTEARLVSDSGPVHVYDGKVTDREAETDARIYVLAPEHDDEDAVTAFESAAREWHGLSKNKHIATVYAKGTKPKPWVAFDDGHERLDDVVTALDRDERVDVIGGVAEAVRTGSMYNLSHGGLRPELVFLADDQDGETIATVADWGLEQTVRESVENTLVTPYTTPEQLDGVNAGDATDIYRLGAVAYRVLTGEHPFAGVTDLAAAIADGNLTPPTEHDSTLPDAVDDVVVDAMASDPDDRLTSLYDFRQRLLGAIED